MFGTLDLWLDGWPVAVDEPLMWTHEPSEQLLERPNHETDDSSKNRRSCGRTNRETDGTSGVRGKPEEAPR